MIYNAEQLLYNKILKIEFGFSKIYFQATQRWVPLYSLKTNRNHNTNINAALCSYLPTLTFSHLLSIYYIVTSKIRKSMFALAYFYMRLFEGLVQVASLLRPSLYCIRIFLETWVINRNHYENITFFGIRLECGCARVNIFFFHLCLFYKPLHDFSLFFSLRSVICA